MQRCPNNKNKNTTLSKISKPKFINEVVDKILIKILPTISGDPDYEYLNKMIPALYANVVTLTKTLAGGKHVHVGLIMKDTLLTTLEMITLW